MSNLLCTNLTLTKNIEFSLDTDAYHEFHTIFTISATNYIAFFLTPSKIALILSIRFYLTMLALTLITIIVVFFILIAYRMIILILAIAFKSSSSLSLFYAIIDDCLLAHYYLPCYYLLH